jgi:hypothetical protein
MYYTAPCKFYVSNSARRQFWKSALINEAYYLFEN